MLRTYTVLFLDYTGHPDYDYYTARCVPEARELFEKDHPGRTIGYVAAKPSHSAATKEWTDVLLRNMAGYGNVYEGVCEEGTTEYIFNHRFEAQSDDSAILSFELSMQEAQEARDSEGGFPLTPLGLYRLYPYKLVRDYTEN